MGRIYPETLSSAGTWSAASSFRRGPVGRLAGAFIMRELWPCLNVYGLVLFTIQYSIRVIGLIIRG